MYSLTQSGTNMQPNGNFVICEATTGRISEITADGDLMWSYLNPVANTNNPDNSLPTLNEDGTYSFISSIPGTYVFDIKIELINGEYILEQLTINVIDLYLDNNNPIANVDITATLINTSVLINTLSNDESGNHNVSIDPRSVIIIEYPNNGGTAFPICFLTAPSPPEKT